MKEGVSLDILFVQRPMKICVFHLLGGNEPEVVTATCVLLFTFLHIMSMLAGPRIKQKISANPRGTAWSNDESKFGQKLMEKFGWTKGKGLGAKEDGNVHHVTVMKKTDSRGVGCSKSQADNWIAHQDDFNSLLASLNDNDKDSQDSAAVISLEKKSKSSKSRVHYQKFTKGKDLSGKSAQDLDCIFGKRKSNSETNTPDISDENSSDEEDSTRHGVITVRSNDSVQDYFAKKMAELKNKAKASSEPSKDSDTGSEENEVSDDTDNQQKVTFTVGESSEEESTTKVKKQKKKRKQDSDDNVELPKKKRVRFSTDKLCEYSDEVKSESQVETIENTVVEDDINNNNNDKTKKRKKKKKGKREHTEEDSGFDSLGSEGDHSNEKKKEKSQSESENVSDNVMESKPKKKKKSKQKSDSETKVSEENAESEHNAKKVSKKKKKKGQSVPDLNCFFDKSMQEKLPKQSKPALPPGVKTVVDSFNGSNLEEVTGYGSSNDGGQFLQTLEKKANKKKNKGNKNRKRKQKRN